MRPMIMYKGRHQNNWLQGELKIGATMGTVIILIMKLESDEDFEYCNDLARRATCPFSSKH